MFSTFASHRGNAGQSNAGRGNPGHRSAARGNAGHTSPEHGYPARGNPGHGSPGRASGSTSLRAILDQWPLTALVRRYRRPLAAICAGMAVLLTLSALKAPAPEVAGAGTAPGSRLGVGEVAAPVTLASPAIAASLDVGDIIDLVAIPSSEAGSATVVARRARVIELGASDGFGASASALVVVAVPEAEALAIADASAGSELTALIH